MFKKFNPQGSSCIIEPYKAPTTAGDGKLVFSHDSNTTFAKVRGTIKEASVNSMFAGCVGRIVFFRRYSTDEYKWHGDNGEEVVYQVDDEDIRCLPEEEVAVKAS